MFARSLTGLPLVTIALVAGAAHAQVTPVTPYYALVSGDSATLRSAPTSNAYSVASIPQNAIVIIDGEASGWNRVLYPAGLHAFVPATAATVSGETVTLARPDELFAASQLKGWGGSWKGLLDQPLPAGTTLGLVETIKEGDVAVAYKVIAPNEARGYVGASSLRKATDSEVESFKAKGNALAALPAMAAPVASNTTSSPTSIDVPADQIVAPVGGTPVTIKRETAELPTPGNATNPTGTPANAPGNTTTTAAAPVKTETRAESLERTFQKVWKEPVLSSEVDELIGEYERAISEETAQNRKTAMGQRLEALKLRRDYRESLRRLEAQKASVDSRQQELNKQLDEWASNRVYTIVGVLQPSTVYDGQRLPGMYRIVSVGGSAPKTLGYIKKGELDLDKYLGMIVGVIGDRTMDQSLQLNLINPVRVDPLRSSLDTTVTATPAHTPASTVTTVPDDTK
ncbi:MAG TPA: hypothetical protein VHN77_09010 [Phycisphaerales bacterium]|nr:hypothetical protein [Phycisphaerales bacterium]